MITLDSQKKIWVLFWLGALASLVKFDLTWGSFHLAPWIGVVTAAVWGVWWGIQWKNLDKGWRWLACVEYALAASSVILWSISLFRSGEFFQPLLQKPFDIVVIAGVVAIAWNVVQKYQGCGEKQGVSVWRKVIWLWLATGIVPAVVVLLLWPLGFFLKRPMHWEFHWFPGVVAMVFIFFAWPAMVLINAVAYELMLVRRTTRILAWGTGVVILTPVWMMLPWVVHCWVTPSFDTFIASHPAQLHEPSAPAGASVFSDSQSLNFVPEKIKKASAEGANSGIQCGTNLQMAVSHGNEKLLDATLDLDFLFHGDMWSYEGEPAVLSTLESVEVVGKVVSHDSRFHGRITAWIEPKWDVPEMEQIKSRKDEKAYPLHRWSFIVRYGIVLVAGPGDVLFKVVRSSHLPVPTYTKEERAERQAFHDAMRSSLKKGFTLSPSAEVKPHQFQDFLTKNAKKMWVKQPETSWELLFPKAAQLPKDGWKFEGEGGGEFFITEGNIVRKYPRGSVWKPGLVDDWIQTWQCRHGKLESFGRFNCDEYSHGWKVTCVARNKCGGMSGTSTETVNQDKVVNYSGETW